MKFKYVAVILSILAVIQVYLLVVNVNHLSLFNDPLSAFGNLTQKYPVFVFGVGLMIILFSFFLYLIYKKENLKYGVEIFLIPIIGIVALLIPYNNEQFINKILHTVLASLNAIIALYVMYKFNSQINLNKITKAMPSVAFFGSLTIFIITGVNSLMQIFFLGIVLFWINIISFRKK